MTAVVPFGFPRVWAQNIGPAVCICRSYCLFPAENMFAFAQLKNKRQVLHCRLLYRKRKPLTAEKLPCFGFTVPTKIVTNEKIEFRSPAENYPIWHYRSVLKPLTKAVPRNTLKKLLMEVRMAFLNARMEEKNEQSPSIKGTTRRT